MPVLGFDHVAIPTAQPKAMMDFYRALGFGVPDYEQWLTQRRPLFSVQFGNNKINMHVPELWQKESFTLRGPNARPGCGDFCFVWSGGLELLQQTLQQAGASVEEGPVERLGGGAGGHAKGTSIYTRDPDQNLLEFIVYPQTP